MMTITMLVLISFLIPMFLVLLVLMVSNKSEKDREKLSPFECGFDPFKKARIPFSLRFFLITIIFLIFDVEIALLLPLGLLNLYSDLFHISMSILLLTAILIMGLMHEWNQGALQWVD